VKKVWGSMLYRCESCGHEERMYLEVGVEGPPGKKKMPCPFCIICPECGALDMVHVDWHKDEEFEPRQIHKGESYFRLDKENECGRPVYKDGPPKIKLPNFIKE